MLLSNKDLYIQDDLPADFANLFCHKNITLVLSTISKQLISFNSLRPSDAYMRLKSNHHWFR